MSALKSTWAPWNLTQTAAKKLGLFWILILGGACFWGGLLLWLTGTPWQNLQQTEKLSQSLSAAYLIGLYAWLLFLCRQFQPPTAFSPVSPSAQLRFFVTGLMLASVTLSLLWLAFAGLGWVEPAPAAITARHILHALLMACALAWIEERVFRGLTLSLLADFRPLAQAIWLQALAYALLHLLRTDLTALEWAVALAGLTLAGVWLALLKQKTGSLALSFGAHAGWICLTSLAAWSHGLHWPPENLLWTGGGNPAYGLGGVLLLGGLCLLTWLLASPAAKPPPVS